MHQLAYIPAVIPPVLVALFLLFAGTPSGCAAVLHVNADATGASPDGSTWQTAFTTVEAAVSAATGGDSVWVAAGRYTSTITLKPGVSLYGGFLPTATAFEDRDPTLNATVLTRDADGYIVTAGAGVGRDTEVDGFQFRYTGKYSGGIQLADASPTIRGNDFSYNIHSLGMSIDARRGAPLVDANVFRLNIVEAIRAWQGAPVITRNVFQGINNMWSSNGVVSVSGTSVITNNIFRGNSNGHYSGAISGSGTGTVLNNVFVGNTAAQHGGAIYWSGGNNLTTIANNSFVGNAAPRGGAISLAKGLYRLANNLIAFNTSGISAADASVSADHNCVFANETGDYDGMEDPTGTAGNLRVDPRITSVGMGEVHLQPDSPCRAAGDPSVLPPDAVDMDGDARQADGAVDIGADEFTGRIWPSGTRIVRVSAAGSDANDGSTWETAMATVGAALDAIAPTGGEVWVAAGLYAERVYLMEYMSLYGGFAGTEGAPAERRPGSASILDGARRGTVVTLSGSGSRSVLDGVTIRNGQDHFGGGILSMGYAASPLIHGNTISGNAAPQSADLNRLHNGYGGGMFCDWNTAPRIVGNTFEANSARDGGALHAFNSSVVFERNVVRGNNAYFSGGLRISSGASGNEPISSISTVRNNIFADNTANADNTCALYVDGRLGINVVNNTFARNKSSVRDGVAVSFYTNAEALFVNNIVSGSTNGVRWSRAAVEFRNNCVYDNTRLDYETIGAGGGNADQTGMHGNIRANPMFVAPALAAFHVQDGSPCVNNGDNTVDAGQWDIDGQPRRQGRRVDIGADETAVAGFTVSDAASALAIAGGLLGAPMEAMSLDIAPSSAPDGFIALDDVAAIARKTVGLD